MAAKKAEEAEFLLAEHTRKEEMEKEKAERDRMAAEVMDFDCEMKNASSAEFSEESELEIELESGESLDSDGALESRVIQPIVAAVTGQVM